MPPSIVPSRRLRRIEIPSEFLVGLCCTGPEVAIRLEGEVPCDARMVFEDLQPGNGMALVFEHPSFDLVPPGGDVPSQPVRFTLRPVAAGAGPPSPHLPGWGEPRPH